ncbi:MAG TPA: preprotein translocase subunit SecG [Verrucomicrobiota bacterium]|nr:preprotein translocase subunit SecG [Verrucomicrobiota bacterium]HNU49619.1 preprotein translocase subunit SecG [Verrucomicrobiota bacterium]
MGLIIGLLTLLLVINSLFLILLILVQLPKKDAGAGLAFGAGTSDALFGAGSGTALSRLTKYGTGLFLAVSMTLAVLYTHQAKASRRDVLLELDRRGKPAASAPSIMPSVSNTVLPVLPAAGTNLVPAAPTSAPVAVPAAAVPAGSTNVPDSPGR